MMMKKKATDTTNGTMKRDCSLRRQALASVKQTMSTVEKNLAAAGVSDEEFDVAVDEAMEDVRRRQS
jgi:hypothetical protein